MQSRPSVASPLKAATAREDHAGLVLEIAPDFAAMARLNEDEYRQMAQKVAGRAVKVRIETAKTAAEAPAAAEVAQKRQQALEDASREPAIQEALDLFNGKVVDVRGGKG